MDKKPIIYAIYDRRRKAVKIGRTKKSAEQRLSELQTGNPERLYLLFTIPGNHVHERQLHRRFATWRIRHDGEWFEATLGVRYWIASYCSFDPFDGC